MPLPRLASLTFLQVQQETTYNTAVAAGSPPYTGLDVFDVKLRPLAKFSDRKSQAGSGRHKGTLGPQHAEISFTTHVYGTASTTWASTLFPACNYTVATSTYSPTLTPPQSAGSGTKSLTIRWYANGMVHTVRGATGTFALTAEAGERPTIQWTFTGTYTAAADASDPSFTVPSATPIEFASSTLTIASYSPICRSFSVDAGNTVTPRTNGLAADGGAYGAVVTDQDAKGRMSIEAQLEGVYAPETDMYALTTRALTVGLGTAGNLLTISAPAMQITAVTTAEGPGGILMHDIEFACQRVAGGVGGDQLTFTTG